jgi:hypothetical protein
MRTIRRSATLPLRSNVIKLFADPVLDMTVYLLVDLIALRNGNWTLQKRVSRESTVQISCLCSLEELRCWVILPELVYMSLVTIGDMLLSWLIMK